MKETYSEMKARHQEETGKLPMFFAFSVSQFDEALEKRGLKREAMAKGSVVALGAGAYCLKNDAEGIMSALRRFSDEIADGVFDYDFAYEAFLYEMNNHEYFINCQGDWDVLSCFGLNDDVSEYSDCKGAHDYMNDMGFGDATKRAYRAAAAEHFRISEAW